MPPLDHAAIGRNSKIAIRSGAVRIAQYGWFLPVGIVGSVLGCFDPEINGKLRSAI